MLKLKAIAAMSENRVIGSAGKIPWHLPEDFRFFKRMTIGRRIIMGRRTFESLGKPLPNRVNLVLTRNPVKLKSDPAFEQLYKSAKLTTASTSELSKHHTGQLGLSIPEATETSLLLMSSMEVVEQYLVDGEAWVIGGATIYQQLLPRCSDLYLTHVKRTVEGETLFPEFLNDFEFKENIAETSEFRIVHYVNRYPGRTHFTPS